MPEITAPVDLKRHPANAVGGLGGHWLLYQRLILRPLWHEKVRTLLSAISIALGVSVVIAIELAGNAAAGSFQSSLETLSGKESLLITATGGLDENLLGALVRIPYPFQFAPRIEDFATLPHGAAVPLIGIDLVGAASEQEPQLGNTDFGNYDNPILAGRVLGWHKGEQVELLVNDERHRCTVAGILPNKGEELSNANVIVTDIGLAQTLTGKIGRLDSIAVKVPSYGALENWEAMVRQALPASASVERAGARTDENRKMLAAFRWNLRVLSYVALVVGAFLIYNTIAVSVARRRTEIGILRAFGATRAAVLWGFLLEAAFFGVLGGMGGLLLGRLFALGAVRLVGNTVQMLYVTSVPAPIRLTPGAVTSGLLLGIGMSLLAALAPAVEASRVPPTEAMATGRRELITRLRAKWHVAGAVLAAATGALTAVQKPIDGRPLWGYASAALFITSAAFAVPLVIELGSRLLGNIAQRIFGVEVFLGLRATRAALHRTSVLVGALTTAVAMMTSVGIMVGSFRSTVALWMEHQLRADLYLRPAGVSGADRHPTIAPEIADRIEAVPGVAAVDRFRVYPISYDGLPASLGAGETRTVEANGATYFLPGEDREAILRELPRGNNAIVSEPFANKHDIRPGDMIRLPLGSSVQRFRVLGIYYDYSTERGFVVMDRKTLLRYLPDEASSSLAVYLKPGTSVEEVRTRIARIIGPRGILLLDNGKLRANALQIFDRTFQVTWALELVAITVAVIGIAGAMLALVIDRRRDYGLLRFLGADQKQIRRIIIAEAGFLGLFANALGLVLGTVLSLVLIFVINKQSFGWTIQFHWPVALLVGALSGVYLATLLSGLYPAHTAVRTDPLTVIHQE